MLRRLLAVLALVLLAAVAAPPLCAAVASDFLYGKVVKQSPEGYDLNYRLLVPAGYDAGIAYPIIVFLHGQGEKGTNNTAQLANNANGALTLVSTANQTAYPCFMLAPQCYDGWNDNSFNQIARLLGQLQSTYNIDHDRIYITGLSMGGGGTWACIAKFPQLFAAAVPMSGWGGGGYEQLVSLPVWAFHAANDPTVAVSGTDNAVNGLRAKGGRVIYTRYATGGHGIWPTGYATPALLPWIMAQRRNQAVTGTPIVTVTTTDSTSTTVVGTASVPGGIGEVRWSTTASGQDVSGYTLAAGTTAWTATGLSAYATRCLIFATGPSWVTVGPGAGGGTTINGTFWHTPVNANTTPPTVAIATPVSGGSFATAGRSLDLAGTAAPAGTKTIRTISWANDRGGSGTASGTTAWSVSGIGLQDGSNVITVTATDSSTIAASVVLRVDATGGTGNTAPTIGAIADQTTTEDVAIAPIAVTIADTETAASVLQLQRTSSDTTLIPLSGIILGGSGANRTVSITPAADRYGSATITLTVSDGSLSAQEAFLVTVSPVNDRPTIGAIADQSVATGTATAALAFTVGDVETAAAALSVTGSSSNTALVPGAAIVIGGSGAARTVTVTPAAGQSGSSTITITVSDDSMSAVETFVLSVLADTTPPATPAAPSASSTSSATPMLSGATEVGATVAIYDDGIQIGSLSAGAGGLWSWTVTPALGTGPHHLTVIASDAASNHSAASPAVVVTVSAPADTTPPATPSAPSASSTSSPTPTLSGTGEASATIRIYDGVVLVQSLTAGIDGAWSWTVSPALTAGVHVITVTASDVAGNVSATSPSTQVTVSASTGTVTHAVSSGTASGGCGAGGLLGLLLLGAGLRRRR